MPLPFNAFHGHTFATPARRFADERRYAARLLMLLFMLTLLLLASLPAAYAAVALRDTRYKHIIISLLRLLRYHFHMPFATPILMFSL